MSENWSDWYILEVDLEYPDELHQLHNDYPLASEKVEIICCQIIIKKIGGVNNLGNKNKYVLHYRNLHLHLLLRMKLVFTEFYNLKDLID